MASTSVETLILFIATMLIAVSVAGTFTESIGQLTGDLVRQGTQVTKRVRTDVEIISDSGSDAVYDEQTTNITLLVKNTGTSTLEAETNAIDLLIEQTYERDFEVTLLTEDPAWMPGSVARIEADTNIAPNSGIHRATLRIYGDTERFHFPT